MKYADEEACMILLIHFYRPLIMCGITWTQHIVSKMPSGFV